MHCETLSALRLSDTINAYRISSTLYLQFQLIRVFVARRLPDKFSSPAEDGRPGASIFLYAVQDSTVDSRG